MIRILNNESKECESCEKAYGYNDETWGKREVDIIYDGDVDPETGEKIGMTQGYTNCGIGCYYNVPRVLGVLD